MGREREEGRGFLEEEKLRRWIGGEGRGREREKGGKEMKRLNSKHLEKRVSVSEKNRKG